MFTPEQLRAAEILIARLVAEAAGDEFDFKSVNVLWLSPENPVCALSDGFSLTTGDFLVAALHLLWLQIQLASEGQADVALAIERLALEIANLR